MPMPRRLSPSGSIAARRQYFLTIRQGSFDLAAVAQGDVGPDLAGENKGPSPRATWMSIRTQDTPSCAVICRARNLREPASVGLTAGASKKLRESQQIGALRRFRPIEP